MKKNKKNSKRKMTKKSSGRFKLTRKSKFSRRQVLALAAVLVLGGIYLVYRLFAASPTLDRFPLDTNKYDLEKNWPSAEARSYLLDHNVHHTPNVASDIFSPPGTPVIAAVGGTVINTNDHSCNNDTGAHAVIRSSDGYTYYYYHMEVGSRTVSLGQNVSAGTRLGKVGNRGCAQGTDPHLHFEVHNPSGSQVDIQKYVTAAFWNKLSSWKRMAALPNGLTAKDIGVMNSTYVGASDGRVYKLNYPSSWTQIAGTGTYHMETGPSNPWRINSLDHYHVLRGTSWTYMNAVGADIGIGSAGSTWLAGTNGNTYQWNGSTSSPSWPRKSTVGQNGAPYAKRIDVSASGNAWIVSSASSNNIYRWRTDHYEHVVGDAKDIGIGGNNGVWIVTPSNDVFYWNGSGWVKTSQGKGVAISVDASGKPWVVGTDPRYVYHYWRGTP